MGSRTRLTILAVMLVGLGITATIVLVPELRFAYRSPQTHIVFETAAAMIAALTALLVYGRLRRTRGLSELLLLGALVLFACANLVFALVPRAFDMHLMSDWAAVGARTAATGLFAAAAAAPRVPIRRARLATLVMLLACAALVTVLLLVGVKLGERGASPVFESFAVGETAKPILTGTTLFLLLQGVTALLFVAAAAGFARRAASGEGALATWLGIAAALGAVARVNYLLVPSLYTSWVYTGDVFRLASYLAILAGAVHEIRSSWQHEAERSVLEERRRLAREFHDGVAQELAFIAARARSSDPQLADAAQRALDESRSAIAALSQPLDQPLASLVAQATEEIALRAGGRVVLELDPDAEAPAAAREAIVRVAREAVVNAFRHARVDTVRVRLSAGRTTELVVADDGVGFDPAAPSAGFGLTSMRERVAATGGSLHIRTAPGRGTRVEVVLP